MINVTVDTIRCKGCGLCVAACKRGVFHIDGGFNAAGYKTAAADPSKACSGCRACIRMCPDICIELHREAAV